MKMSQLLSLFLVFSSSLMYLNSNAEEDTQQLQQPSCCLDFTADLIRENTSTIAHISIGMQESRIKIEPHVGLKLSVKCC